MTLIHCYCELSWSLCSMEDGGGGGGGGGKNDKGDVTYEVCDCQYISVRGNLTFGAGNVSCLLTLADVAD